MKQQKLKPTKALQKAVGDYRKLRAAGKIEEIKLFEEAGKYFGKKGGLLKKATRSNKAKAALNVLQQKYQREWRGGAGAAMQRRQEEKNIKNAEKLAKQRATYAKNQQAKAQMPDFKAKAQDIENKYDKMLEVFKTDVYHKLLDTLHIDSGIVVMLVEEGWDPKNIIEFLENVKNMINQLPDESIALAMQDDMWRSLMEFQKMADPDKEDFAMYANLGIGDFAQDLGKLRELYSTWETSGTEKTFANFAKEVEKLEDPFNKKSWEELLE